jgi:hypothetical protein
VEPVQSRWSVLIGCPLYECYRNAAGCMYAEYQWTNKGYLDNIW